MTTKYCTFFGVDRFVVYRRLSRGWTLERAICTPVREYRRAAA